MNNETILNIDSVRKSFVSDSIIMRNNEEEENHYLFKDINLEIKAQKVTALIGGNGTGKTTLFNIISGFTKADEGKVGFKKNGSFIELTGLSPYKITQLGIGRMFQDNHIFQNMTVLENMLISDDNTIGERPFEAIFLYQKCKNSEKTKKEKAEQVFIELFGKNNAFLKLINEKAKNLSYGQQRLLGLARLLMGSYKLLLLDEPTSGVNPVLIEKIKEIINIFVTKNKGTIFFIEHNKDFICDVASDGYIISKKGIIYGKPKDIFGNPEFRKDYLGI